MNEMFRDSVWQFLQVLVAVVALAVTIVLSIHQRRKRLSYEVISSSLLLSIREDIEDKIRIFYEDVEVRQVHLIVIQVVNSGNIPVESADFERALSLSFGEHSRIISDEITATVPEGLDIGYSVENGIIAFEPCLLNSKDSFTMTVLVSDYQGHVNIDARVVGVKEVEETGRGDDHPRLRPVFLSIVLGIYVYLAWRVSELLGHTLDGASFTAAIAVTALTGFTWFLVNGWWSTVTRPCRPQKVTSGTRGTPSQI